MIARSRRAVGQPIVATGRPNAAATPALVTAPAWMLTPARSAASAATASFVPWSAMASGDWAAYGVADKKVSDALAQALALLNG